MTVLLNDRLHDWVSLTLVMGPPIGKVPLTVQTIDYPEHGQETKLQWGSAGARPIGFTRDHYDVTQLSIEMLQGEWASARTALGPGYGQTLKIPAISIVYSDPLAGLNPITDTFLNLTLTKEQPTVSQGTDPAKIKLTFQPTEMVLNGVPYALPVPLK